jgi:long-chain acyl-CoA synthetase
MHKEFDADEAELTRTRKIRREFMEERYKELIESMYSSGSEIIVKAPVTYRDGRKGFVSTSIKVRDISK